LQKTEYHFKKKSLAYQERSEEKRQAFQDELKEIPEEMRVYIDESGIDKYLYRPCGRAPSGESIQGFVSGKRYQRESFIAGKISSKIVAPFCYQGTCNTDLFNLWIKDFLIPDLNPIETFWASLKNLVRETLKKVGNLSRAIDQAFLTYVT
jgi:hypothetical protein